MKKEPLVRFIRFNNISSVKEEMERIGTDPEGVRRMAEKAIPGTFKIEGVSPPAANILKQEMLAAGGDAAVARGVINCSIKRSDVLILGSRKQIRKVAKKIKKQPFGLSLIADKIEKQLSIPDRKQLNIGNRNFEFGSRTYIMGVLNVTPDSFSDGGKFLPLDNAVRHAEDMLSSGADIIDVGGESSRPGSDPVPLEEELERVVPVVGGIAKRFDAVISIDTYKSEVARQCLDEGAHIVNDISAFRFDPGMGELLLERKAYVVLMHMLGNPKDMQKSPSYSDVVGEIYSFLGERVSFARSIGIDEDRIIVDPGIGFGKLLEHNIEILKRLGEFSSIGYPILVGPSRKSFIGKILDLPAEERMEGTASAVALAIANGADIVRVHDVQQMARVAKLADAIVRT